MASKQAKRGFARYWPRLLLILPLMLVVWVPFYNRIEPTLGDIPFFYWYQLAGILVGAAIVLVVYLLETRLTGTTDRSGGGMDETGTPGDVL